MSERTHFSQDSFDDVAPDPSAMIESMRAHGYTLQSAVADIVDNSIAADCTTVWVTCTWSGGASWITVVDDGFGMSEETLRNAMRLGSKSPLADRELQDLGRFGLGLKTASLSQCRRLTVESKAVDSQHAARCWDLDHLLKPEVNTWQLLKVPRIESKERLKVARGVLQDGTGTVVLWEVLDRLVGEADVTNERVRDHFHREIAALEQHLCMVFHRFLAGPRPALRILLNGNELEPWDPFLQDHAATQSTPVERIRETAHGAPVLFQGFVLPHKDKLGPEAHKAAAGPAGWNAQQGFYLYRNKRLIVAGSWLGLGTVRAWTQEEHYKLARIQLDIPNSMDHLWQLDVKKSSAKPPALIRKRLTVLAEAVRRDAREVFAHRGKYGPRGRKQAMARPWVGKKSKGTVRYRIDRSHPFVSAVLSAAPGELKKQLQAMLRVLEETVPIQQIWLDASESPEDPALPFQGTTERQLRLVIEVSYSALRRNKGLSHSQAIQELLGCQEFSDQKASAIIGALPETE